MKAIYWVGMMSNVVFCLACDRNEPGPDVVDHQEPTGMAPVPNVIDKPDDRENEKKVTVEAKVDMQAAEGSKIDGEATLVQEGEGVKIVVNVRDAPVGEKGIHIHEKGDCSDIAGKSMGEHFAPDGEKHGLPGALGDRHLGDLGNIEIKDDGTGRKEITLDKANLNDADKMSLLGKALVIHQDKDKGADHQPSGGSGDPIACGVISKS